MKENKDMCQVNTDGKPSFNLTINQVSSKTGNELNAIQMGKEKEIPRNNHLVR